MVRYILQHSKDLRIGAAVSILVLVGILLSPMILWNEPSGGDCVLICFPDITRYCAELLDCYYHGGPDVPWWDKLNSWMRAGVFVSGILAMSMIAIDVGGRLYSQYKLIDGSED